MSIIMAISGNEALKELQSCSAPFSDWQAADFHCHCKLLVAFQSSKNAVLVYQCFHCLHKGGSFEGLWYLLLQP